MNLLKIPPLVWTLFFTLLAAGANYLAGWPTILLLHSLPVGIGIMAVSLIAPVWSVLLFVRAGTQVHPTSKTNNKLVTSGPFQFTRNPMYFGIVAITLGWAVATGGTFLFVVPVLLFGVLNWVQIPFEEAKMRRQFGTAFDDYAGNVRRWI